MRASLVWIGVLGTLLGLSAGAPANRAGAFRDGPPPADPGPGHVHSSASPAISGDPGDLGPSLAAVRDRIARDLADGRLESVQEQARELARRSDSWQPHAAHIAPGHGERVGDTLRRLSAAASELGQAAGRSDVPRCRTTLGRIDALLAQLPGKTPRSPEPRPSDSSHHAATHGSDHSSGHSGQHRPSSGHGDTVAPAHMHGAAPLARVHEDPQEEVRVDAREFAFSPTTIRMSAGVPTRIALVNQGAVDHALVIRSAGDDGDLIHLHARAGATDSGTFRLDRPGRYAMACTIPGHQEAGMEGEIVVEAR